MPPEPNVIINNATVEGVDSNSNGVRDDIERIAAKTAKTQEDFEKTMAYAKAEEHILIMIVPDSREKGLLEISKSYCALNMK